MKPKSFEWVLTSAGDLRGLYSVVTQGAEGLYDVDEIAKIRKCCDMANIDEEKMYSWRQIEHIEMAIIQCALPFDRFNEVVGILQEREQRRIKGYEFQSYVWDCPPKEYVTEDEPSFYMAIPHFSIPMDEKERIEFYKKNAGKLKTELIFHKPTKKKDEN